MDIPTVAGSFIVNIGDARMRWTNDRWVSTVHRVVNPPDGAHQNSRRQSIAYFHNPNVDALIDCLEPFTSRETPARCEPIGYVKYRQAHGAAA